MNTSNRITIPSEPQYLNEQHKADSEALKNSIESGRRNIHPFTDTTKPVSQDALKAASDQLAAQHSLAAPLPGNHPHYTVPVPDETDVRDLRGVVPFASTDEVVEAMKDPRYKTSAAYVQSVTRRIAAGK